MTRADGPRLPRLATRSARRFRSDETGAAAIELAIVLPVLTLILFTIIEFGLALNSYIELVNGVAAGERVLSISRGQPSGTYTAITSAVTNAATNLKSASFTYTVSVNGTTCTSTSLNSGGACYKALAQNVPSTVTVSYPCSLTYLKIKIPNCTLTASSTEVVQ